MNRVSDIRTFISNRIGGAISDADVLREINIAWQEIWDAYDLPNCLETILVRPEGGESFLTLPGCVGRVQGIKFSQWGPNVVLNYPTTYYAGTGPKWQSLLEWRSVDIAATKRALDNVGPLTLKIPNVLETDVEVTIIGPGAGSARIKEVVTIPAGEREATSDAAFGPDIRNITKDVVTAFDITIYDKDDNEVAVLAADQFETRYILLRLWDACNVYINPVSQCFEVLYKKRCPLLWFDEDTIPEPHHLTVQNAAVASILARRSGDGDLKRANVFAARAGVMMGQLSAGELRGTSVPVNVGQNSIYHRWWGHL
jgi:hypothetical protein